MSRLKLPTVALCAAASVNVRATIEALGASLQQVDFAECLFFTDQEISNPPKGITVKTGVRLTSASDYSEFLLRGLSRHLRTPHCLIVQWDGFVLDAARWEESFLDYDYLGAPWPQFTDGHDVGNGGFSLRSRRLVEACRDLRFKRGDPEDVAICRTNRDFLEQEHGLRFADRTTAERFSFERTSPVVPTFGFHGIFNLIPALGPDRFWKIYRSLDDPSTAFVDYPLLMRQLGAASNALPRRLRLTYDRLKGLLSATPR